MPDGTAPPNDDWQKIWDARINGLSAVLGKPTDHVLHAPLPFAFGGNADVLEFHSFIQGITYVTAELTGSDAGQQPNSLGNYELMICTKESLHKAGDFISNLARYTCDAVVQPGQTMDVNDYFGEKSIRAMLFTHPRDEPTHFNLLGQNCGLLLCIGITSDELKFARSRGSDKLLALLKQHGLFPYTQPDRSSVPLPKHSSFFGKLFGK